MFLPKTEVMSKRGWLRLTWSKSELIDPSCDSFLNRMEVYLQKILQCSSQFRVGEGSEMKDIWEWKLSKKVSHTSWDEHYIYRLWVELLSLSPT